jgi:hypothetical protein
MRLALKLSQYSQWQALGRMRLALKLSQYSQWQAVVDVLWLHESLTQ